LEAATYTHKHTNKQALNKKWVPRSAGKNIDPIGVFFGVACWNEDRQNFTSQITFAFAFCTRKHLQHTSSREHAHVHTHLEARASKDIVTSARIARLSPPYLKKTKKQERKKSFCPHVSALLAKSSVSYFRFTYKEIERAAREETWH
jgi:hypothetical protein